jgi:hypothetical protein
MRVACIDPGEALKATIDERMHCGDIVHPKQIVKSVLGRLPISLSVVALTAS